MKFRDLVEERAKFGFGSNPKSMDLPKEKKTSEGFKPVSKKPTKKQDSMWKTPLYKTNKEDIKIKGKFY